MGSSPGSTDCEVTEDKKKCIACRYQRCLLIGMDPALVQVRARLSDNIIIDTITPCNEGDEKETTKN